MAGSPLLWGPRAGGVGLLVLLLLGLFQPPSALCARPVKVRLQSGAGWGWGRMPPARVGVGAAPPHPRPSRLPEPRGLSAASPPLAETGDPRRFRRSVPRGEAAAGAVQELARALAHLLEAERQERARAEAQEAEDQQARVLAQLLRVWGAPRNSDPALGLDDDPDAPAAQLARALLRARLDPAALAAQLVPAPVPAAALRPRPPVYDDGPAGPDAEEAGDETPDVDPELLRYLLGRILAGSADSEGVAAPRRLRRAADQDVGSDVPPEGVLGALLRVKRLETPAPQVPARRLLPP
ncbi:proSAAS isoform X1 [Macaca nemestrina]|uniref:proSAAS isoform X1 n=1 Tax=Macaca mulatta TaxID=9544 RepID=UPI0010A2595B|nr:proSAAS isoform X1 [Macaca mulatta]XP_045239154.1 proSAAS isoform X1 [Macaca fascicularis]